MPIKLPSIDMIDLFTVYSSFSVIPTIVGIFLWSRINFSIRFLVLFQLIANILTLITNVLAFQKNINTHFILYCHIANSAIFLSLFFYIVFAKRVKLILIFPVFVALFLIIDYLMHGKKDMNILPFIFIDIFVIICSLLFLNHSNPLSKTLTKTVILLLVYHVYDVIFNFLTSYFYQYLSDGVFNLMWFWVNPIVGIVYYIFLTYFIYLSIEKHVPDFDKVFDAE
jgi:hypothetical protein